MAVRIIIMGANLPVGVAVFVGKTKFVVSGLVEVVIVFDAVSIVQAASVRVRLMIV